MPRKFKQKHPRKMWIGPVRKSLRRQKQELKSLEGAIFGRQLQDVEFASDNNLKQELTESGVNYTLGQAGLVYLMREQSKSAIQRHGSDIARTERQIKVMGEQAAQSLVVARQELYLHPNSYGDERRSFSIVTYPHNAFNSKQRPVSVREEQYIASCALGDFYADEPQLWLGRIEGPSNTDAIEEIVYDRLEEIIPTDITVGRLAMIMADPARPLGRK